MRGRRGDSFSSRNASGGRKRPTQLLLVVHLRRLPVSAAPRGSL
jgi:hypothetical protein